MSRRMLLGFAAMVLLVGCTSEAPGPANPPVPVATQKVSGDVVIRGCAPGRPLLPADTLDSCGLRILDGLTARLYRANTDTGVAEADLADSVDTSDSQNFTVRLARGRFFHDGTEVRARNFVAAWNWAAYGPNRMSGQNFFSPIDGAEKMLCTPGRPCSKDGRPTALSGLKVLDDYTFTVRTTQPLTDFKERLSHPVFAPLPDAFFPEDEGKENFGKLPVGAGPFKIASSTASEFALEAFDGYTGRYPAQVRRVTLRMYDDTVRTLDVSRAYNDVVANRLDFTDVIPSDQLVGEQWHKELPGRWSKKDLKLVDQLVFDLRDPQLLDPRIRRAISMGIDREALGRQVFNSTRNAATSWVSPLVPGYRGDACGPSCSYDPQQARTLYRAAGAYQGNFFITVNGDIGSKQWADALCNQLKNSLELDCQVRVLGNQAQVVRQLQDGRLGGLVHTGSVATTPTPEPYLSSFGTASWNNVGRYSNAGFDQRLQTAAGATSQAAANDAYRQAEELLAQDMPSIPLWVSTRPVSWSNRVTDIKVTTYGTLDLSSIKIR